MMHHLRFAARTLRRQPLPYALAVLCLGLGLGSNAALFGVIDAILFRPPPEIGKPSELVRVRVGAAATAAVQRAGPSATYPQYQAIREQQKTLIPEIAAYSYRDLGFGHGAATEPLSAVFASTNYFTTLGVRPRIGRFFDAGDASSLVVVISYDLWRRSFGGSPDVIGKQLLTPAGGLTVIGVTPQGFVGADLGARDAWLPLELAFADGFGTPRNRTGRVYWLQLIGRVRSDVSLAQARNHVSGVETSRYAVDAVDQVPISLLPLRALFLGAQAGQNPVPAWLTGITLSLLLLACATVANLLLAQAGSRGSEMSVRLALGATRAGILRQLLVENLLWAGLGSLCGVLVALWSGSLLQHLPIPPVGNIITWRTAGFLSLLSFATVLLFGLAPALWSVRRDVAGVLKSAGRAAPGAAFLQRSLMAVQIAISFALLFCAVLFVQSLRNLKAIDTGLDIDRVVTATVDRSAVQKSLELLGADPGVEQAASGSLIPFYLYSRYGYSVLDGRPDEEQPRGVLTNVIDPEYFDVMQLRAVAGRLFTSADGVLAPRAAAVSQRLAQQFWPGRSPIGACLDLMQLKGPCITVVGVVSDARYEDLQGPPSELVYLPASQAAPLAGRTVFVRTRGPAAGAVEDIRSLLQPLQPTGVFVRAAPLDNRLRPERVAWEVAAGLFSVFGTVAAALAAIGLFTVVSFLMAQRTRELGIRSALGATRARIVRLVLATATRIITVGLAIGVLLAAAASSLVRTKVVDVTVLDPRIFIGVGVLLLAVGLLASVVPAVRAAGRDPLLALRTE